MKDAQPSGLYVPQQEGDACGIGLLANLSGEPNHRIIESALGMLCNMEHRGARGCESNTGDGAGILIQIPDRFLRDQVDVALPGQGQYGLGMVFFPSDPDLADRCRVSLYDYIDECGLELITTRPVPTDNSALGASARSTEPCIEQVFVRPVESMDAEALERRLYVLRKYAGHRIHRTFPQVKNDFYICSFSTKTVVYKGQLTTHQVRSYYPDLQDPDSVSAIALVHSRFSTNTVPMWKLAQPFRTIAHNGEINTIAGNLNWWRSKEKMLESTAFTAEEMEKIFPVCGKSLSDSGNFDNVLEFLLMSGFSLPHALMMMIPEAWEHDPHMPVNKKAFYEYHKAIMEPWDGPASICFTDGTLVGATLDRNGLRPSRYCLTKDNILIVASEAGALPVDPADVVMKGCLQPGRMLVADLEAHRIIADPELKENICQQLPYRHWLDRNRKTLDDLPEAEMGFQLPEGNTLVQRQQLFGFSREDLRMIIQPMVSAKKDPTGSMGADTPLAVLSQRPQHLANYFKQLFAQVTNPPIDPIRERSIMSLQGRLGSVKNILSLHPDKAKFLHLDTPVLLPEAFNKIRLINEPDLKAGRVDILFRADGQKGRLKAAIEHICAVAEDMTRNGHNILVLSDRKADSYSAPIPSLLAAGAIHHHLIREGLRGQTSLVVDAGDVRETHHFATLIGYGVSAIHPYLTYQSIGDLHRHHYLEGMSLPEALRAYRQAVGKGLLKIMSKIGISTLQSYQGAQIFEALGIRQEVVDRCFSGTISRIEGMGFDDLAREVLLHHEAAYQDTHQRSRRLDVGGVFQWKRDGEAHLFNPKSIHYLQLAARKNDPEAYRQYAELINNQNQQAMTLRGLLTFRKRPSVPIEEVEPVENILTRFVTGAMSFGSISHEAHSTLAIAMNRVGGKSNSGEGGEDPIRYERKANGDSEASATKQVASGRFGVTSHYLTMAKEIQIKMAQGAKPGEGGQLPGHKVDDWIGRVRHSTPGVGLISPPPHHDIYSIEDLAQLIFDLKNANPTARINVKLVSKAGVGVIASGVAKAHADALLISGHDGGTGASPLTSIRHAGLPWELGLAETQQTLVRNGLRQRVRVQVDGQIRTGRDLAIATLLGAEEWGVATAALIVEGCILMRKCHLNTCPVGIATQNPELRKRFTGKPEHIINYLTFMAEELRTIMAQLGFRTVDEMVGKVELLKLRQQPGHWKYKLVDLSPILYKEPSTTGTPQYNTIQQDHGIENVLDRRLIRQAQLALDERAPVQSAFTIRSTDRSVGAMLSFEISRRYGETGLPQGTIRYRFRGSAGQSFGAFGANGLHFVLEGEANDYFGKGLSGGRLIVAPDRDAGFAAAENIIIGNVALYGATEGEAYVHGLAGERFAVRNSGVKAVVEGVGDHACEYMTGGIVLVLGETGKNFAAGMSGGIAYVYDKDGRFPERVNGEMVDLDPLDAIDHKRLQLLIRNHLAYTGSNKAMELLQHWSQAREHFIKVMPRDYKRVLEKNTPQPKLQLTVATQIA